MPPYIGNSPANIGNYQIVDDISSTFNGVLTSFALTAASQTINPAKSGQLLVSINGVLQEPDDTVTEGFKVSGSNIVFSSAPATGSTFWAVWQGQAVDIGTPSDSTVGTAQLSATGTKSGTTYLAGDNTWKTVVTDLVNDTTPQLGGDLDLNGHVITGLSTDPTMGGDLSGTASNAQLVANAVGTTEIANSAVTDAKIAGMSSSKLSGALPAIDGSALTGVASAKHIGVYSPLNHNTASAGWQDMDLSRHHNLISGSTSYLTQSANILTIVKPGLYQVYVHTLTDTNSTSAEMDLYLYATGYQTQYQRIQPAGGWSTMVASGTYQLSTGNTINVRIQNSSPTTYHHHEGPEWTSMTVTYLG